MKTIMIALLMMVCSFAQADENNIPVNYELEATFFKLDLTLNRFEESVKRLEAYMIQNDMLRPEYKPRYYKNHSNYKLTLN